MEKQSDKQDRLQGLPPLQIITVDHYNTKWAVLAIEWLRRRRIAEHILDHPRRICMQVLESGMVPRGRFFFYNGVGGALADMLAHLLQPLRALSGLATVKDLLSALRVVQIKRARYDMPDSFLFKAHGADAIEDIDLSSKLGKETETFGLIELQFIGPPWNGTPVYIRTGKGIFPQSKLITVEGFDDDGRVALICDLDKRQISLADCKGRTEAIAAPNQANEELQLASLDRLPNRIWMRTQEIEIPGLVSGRPIRPEAEEYVEIFSALCNWESPDPRIFPPIEDAAQVCDFFYNEILRDRAANPAGIDKQNVYAADYSGRKVRAWLSDRAGWY